MTWCKSGLIVVITCGSVLLCFLTGSHCICKQLSSSVPQNIIQLILQNTQALYSMLHPQPHLFHGADK